MTDAQAALAQVREALSAGPTPGPWHHDSDPIKNDPLHRVRFRVTAKGRTITETYYSSAQPGAPFTSGEADNRFIAACSPANIAAVLAHVDAQAAEIERLRSERDESLAAAEAAHERANHWTEEAARYHGERDELRRQLAEAERDSAMLDYVEQVFIDEGSGLELYPFGAVEDYADDRETVIGWKFLFGNAQGPTLRDAIYYAMGLTRPAEES